MNGTTLDDWIARHFPGESGRIYLDTAAAGIAPRELGSAVASFYDGPLRVGISGRPQWRAKSETVRKQLAALMNISAAEIEFFGNTTQVMNLVAHAISWAAGDEIVLAMDEHASVRNAWEGARRAGVKLVLVPIADERRRMESLLDAVTPRTRVVAVSHVHSVTGCRLDLGRMREFIGDSACLLVVDGIQALGAIPVDASLADVYCAATFKWLCAGFGLSVMTASAKARASMQPPFRGYVNEPPSESLQYSHWNYPGLWALAHALDIFGDLGWARVHRAVDDNARTLWSALARADADLRCPEGSLAGIVTVRLGDQAAEVGSKLSAAGIQATIRGGDIRLSAHAYVSHRQIEDACDLVKEAFVRAQRR